MANKKVTVKLVKSLIGCKPNQVKTAQALGLTKINKTIELELNDQLIGMVRTIAHLVEVYEN